MRQEEGWNGGTGGAQVRSRMRCPMGGAQALGRRRAEGARAEEARGGWSPSEPTRLRGEGPRPRHGPRTTQCYAHTHQLTRAHAHTHHGTGRSAGATPLHTRRGPEDGRRQPPPPSSVNGPERRGPGARRPGLPLCPPQPPRPVPHPHSTHPPTAHFRRGAGVRGVGSGRSGGEK